MFDPEEYAVGEEVTGEFRNPAPGIRISIGLSNADAKLLLAESKRRGISFTELAEEMVRNSLGDSDQSAEKAAS